MAPPATPSDLAGAFNTDDTITLTWTDNATTEDGYRVFESADGGNSFTNVSGDLAADTTSYATDVQDLDIGYVYFVEAFNVDGTSQSAEVLVIDQGYVIDSRMERFSKEPAVAPPADAEAGAGGGPIANLSGYIVDENMDRLTTEPPAAPPAAAEAGAGGGPITNLTGYIVDENMDAQSADSNIDPPAAAEAGAGGGPITKLVGYVTDENFDFGVAQPLGITPRDNQAIPTTPNVSQGFLFSDTVQRDPGVVDWPITIKETIRIRLDDVSRVTDVNLASWSDECSIDQQIDRMETSTSTNEIILGVTLTYTCADNVSEATANSQVTVQTENNQSVNAASREIKQASVPTGVTVSEATPSYGSNVTGSSTTTSSPPATSTSPTITSTVSAGSNHTTSHSIDGGSLTADPYPIEFSQELCVTFDDISDFEDVSVSCSSATNPIECSTVSVEENPPDEPPETICVTVDIAILDPEGTQMDPIKFELVLDFEFGAEALFGTTVGVPFFGGPAGSAVRLTVAQPQYGTSLGVGKGTSV